MFIRSRRRDAGRQRFSLFSHSLFIFFVTSFARCVLAFSDK